MPRIYCSLIQGDFGGYRGNFEAVVLEGDSLNHWYRDNTVDGFPWKRGQAIVESGAAAAGCIIQSDFSSSDHGNFEELVPVWNASQTMDLWHFYHDNSDVSLPWQRAQLVATNVAGPASIIQSDFRSGDHGNFEVVVPLFDGSSADLWHFFHDNSDVSLPWSRGERIAVNVAGPGCVIQSNFGSGTHGNFEVVVPEYAGDGTRELWHYFHDNSDVSLPWQRAQRVAANTNGPGVILQSDFGSGDHGNFEVVVPLGNSLVHFYHDNSDVSLPWGRGQNITDACNGWGSLMRSNFGPFNHLNFEILVEECTQSLAAYWHPNQDVSLPWMRDQVLIGEPYPAISVIDVRKIVQLTGEYDREGWDGAGTPRYAYNRTQSRFGVRGCDLGSSFMHKNRVFFLFGDTERDGWPDSYDAVAFCTDTDPTWGLSLTFYKQPPLLPPNIPQGGFDVPLDGVSWGGSMYVFFSTDAYEVDGRTIMGRSLLARSDNDGYDFTPVQDFSRWKFINVSLDVGPADGPLARALGIEAGSQVLWIFGSGRYRASSVYLAALSLDRINQLSPIAFFTGNDLGPNEADAGPIFCSSDVGELCGRWNPFLQRWLVTYNSGNPRGILLRSARDPFGPYSEPVMLFDSGRLSNPDDPCSGAGYGAFMHIPCNVRVCDHVQDNMWGSNRDNDWGGEYGPYQIAHYTNGKQGQYSMVYFTMSTWNPYQVMLMSARITQDMVR